MAMAKTLLVLAALALAATASALALSGEDIKQQWATFKVTHGKSYSSSDEEARRMAVFAERLLRIQKHNARFQRGEVSYEMEINKFSDLLPQELAAKSEPSLKVERNLDRLTPYKPSRDSLRWPWSTHVDWRKKGYVTPVKDQGSQCNAGYAFSAVGAVEGQLFAKTGKLVSLSVQQLLDCDFTSGNNGCSDGWADNSFAYIEEHGIDSDQRYPYTGKVASNCSYSASDSVAKVTYFYLIQTEPNLEDAVTKVGPIAAKMNADLDSFLHYKRGVYDDAACVPATSHTVLVVGYGKTLGKEYWLAKNSWGTSWGDDGYFKIARNKNNMCGIAAWATYPKVED